LLERVVCLHPRLYRKILPTVGDGNVVRWKGLDGVLSGLHPGEVVASHLRFRPEYPTLLERRGVLPLFLIRDPRDIVVSQVQFVARTASHRQHDVFTRIEDPRERLRLSILGDRRLGVSSIAERLDGYAGWLRSGALVVRFEDLVGPDGGGDRDAQVNAVRSIYRFLGLGEEDRLVRSVAARVFSAQSPTFRRGLIGGWREAFDPELEALFDVTVGERMIPYGYATSPKSNDEPGVAADKINSGPAQDRPGVTK
jgi:hypothetical protein